MADSTPANEISVSRSRGIAWVGDLTRSSRLLNNNETAEALEEFLPRLYWFSSLVVEAAGGRFVKWSGDGFLAWFETPLIREVDERASMILYAAYWLSLFVNISQLGVGARGSERMFSVRQGVCIEHDALAMQVTKKGMAPEFDLIGRGVTFAFRLAGVPAPTPGIVAHEDVIKAARRVKLVGHYRKASFTKEDRLRYFKGERWGTSSVYKSADRLLSPSRRHRNVSSAAAPAKKVLADIESITEGDLDVTTGTPLFDEFHASFQRRVEGAPPWTTDMWIRYVSWVVDAAKALESFVEFAEKQANRAKLD